MDGRTDGWIDGWVDEHPKFTVNAKLWSEVTLGLYPGSTTYWQVPR